jgi:hypothetical protein
MHACSHSPLPGVRVFFFALSSKRKRKPKTPLQFLYSWVALGCSPFPLWEAENLFIGFRSICARLDSLSSTTSLLPSRLDGQEIADDQRRTTNHNKVSKTHSSTNLPSQDHPAGKTHILCVSLLMVNEKQHLTLSLIPLFNPKPPVPDAAPPSAAISGDFKLQLVRIAFWL